MATAAAKAPPGSSFPSASSSSRPSASLSSSSFPLPRLPSPPFFSSSTSAFSLPCVTNVVPCCCSRPARCPVSGDSAAAARDPPAGTAAVAAAAVAAVGPLIPPAATSVAVVAAALFVTGTACLAAAVAAAALALAAAAAVSLLEIVPHANKLRSREKVSNCSPEKISPSRCLLLLQLARQLLPLLLLLLLPFSGEQLLAAAALLLRCPSSRISAAAALPPPPSLSIRPFFFAPAAAAPPRLSADSTSAAAATSSLLREVIPHTFAASSPNSSSWVSREGPAAGYSPVAAPLSAAAASAAPAAGAAAQLQRDACKDAKLSPQKKQEQLQLKQLQQPTLSEAAYLHQIFQRQEKQQQQDERQEPQDEPQQIREQQQQRMACAKKLLQQHTPQQQQQWQQQQQGQQQQEWQQQQQEWQQQQQKDTSQQQGQKALGDLRTRGGEERQLLRRPVGRGDVWGRGRCLSSVNEMSVQPPSASLTRQFSSGCAAGVCSPRSSPKATAATAFLSSYLADSSLLTRFLEAVVEHRSPSSFSCLAAAVSCSPAVSLHRLLPRPTAVLSPSSCAPSLFRSTFPRGISSFSRLRASSSFPFFLPYTSSSQKTSRSTSPCSSPFYPATGAAREAAAVPTAASISPISPARPCCSSSSCLSSSSSSTSASSVSPPLPPHLSSPPAFPFSSPADAAAADPAAASAAPAAAAGGDAATGGDAAAAGGSYPWLSPVLGSARLEEPLGLAAAATRSAVGRPLEVLPGGALEQLQRLQQQGLQGASSYLNLWKDGEERDVELLVTQLDEAAAITPGQKTVIQLPEKERNRLVKEMGRTGAAVVLLGYVDPSSAAAGAAAAAPPPPAASAAAAAGGDSSRSGDVGREEGPQTQQQQKGTAGEGDYMLIGFAAVAQPTEVQLLDRSGEMGLRILGRLCIRQVLEASEEKFLVRAVPHRDERRNFVNPHVSRENIKALYRLYERVNKAELHFRKLEGKMQQAHLVSLRPSLEDKVDEFLNEVVSSPEEKDVGEWVSFCAMDHHLDARARCWAMAQQDTELRLDVVRRALEDKLKRLQSQSARLEKNPLVPGDLQKSPPLAVPGLPPHIKI